MGSNTASVAVTGVDIWQGGFSHTKDQVVAEFDLREEQLVLAAGLPALAFGKERGQAGEPFLAAASQVLGRPGVGQLLEAFGCRASQKSVGALLEIEALLAHAVRQPVMLIETHPAEAFAAGYGGIAAVAMATGVAPSTIGRGLKELAQDEPSERIRRGSWTQENDLQGPDTAPGSRGAGRATPECRSQQCPASDERPQSGAFQKKYAHCEFYRP